MGKTSTDVSLFEAFGPLQETRNTVNTMNDHSHFNTLDLPVYGEESDVTYTIEMIAELADVDSRTILRYQESGFIRPINLPGKEEPLLFDNECLRMLRRIEHLRSTYAVNEAGLKLILDLLREVEILRQDRRAARR